MNEGIRRFTDAMAKLGDLAVLSVLWAVCCLPVLTAVPASAALYYAVRKSVCSEEGHAAQSFFHSFRENLWPGIGIGAICAAYAFITLLWWRFAEGYSVTTAMGMAFACISRTLALFGVLLCSFLCPVLSRFSQGMSETLKSAAFLTFRHFATTIARLVLLGVAALSIYLMPLCALLIPGLCTLASTRLIEPIFAAYLPERSEGADA